MLAKGINARPLGGVHTELLHQLEHRAAPLFQLARRFVIVYNAFHVAQHHAVLVGVHLPDVVGTALGVLIYKRLLVGVGHASEQRVELAVIILGWHRLVLLN